MQVASASTLIQMAAPYRERGIIVGPSQRAAHTMGDQLQGPRIRPRRFSSRRAQLLGLWQDHHFDQALRDGTVPGMEMASV